MQREKEECQIESKLHARDLLSYVCVCISFHLPLNCAYFGIVAVLEIGGNRLGTLHNETEIELSCAWHWLFISFDYFILN